MSKLENRVKIKEASLNVMNLDFMADFYTCQLGFELIEKGENTVALGFGDRVLLRLNKIPGQLTSDRVTGLYHIAYLVPTRKDLGNALFSLLSKKVSLTGAADHGYSEALYLNDPEGNGIEIYRDKPVEEWEITEDGKIVGVTEPVYADQILAARDTETPVGLSKDTIIGHMHLSIKDYKQTGDFYTKVLGFDNKYEFTNQAMFLAAGLYHHDIAINIWNSLEMELRQDSDFGLDNFIIQISDKNDYNNLIERLDNNKEYILDKTEKSITIKDNQNIKITCELV